MDEKTYKQLKVYQTIAAISIVLNIALGFYLITDRSGKKNILSSTSQLASHSDFAGRGFGFDIGAFINQTTGELNQTAIDEMKTRFGGSMPEMFFDRFEIRLQDAVNAGDITAEQANNILNALKK